MKSINKLKDQARGFEQKEEWEKAAQLYLQAVRQAEQEGDAAAELGLYNRIGDLYLRLGKPAEAVAFYEEAADHYAADGLYNNAIALCNKALRHLPQRLELYRKLGRLSASQGFHTDARRWFLEYAERQIKTGNVDEAFAALGELADLTDDAEVRQLLARQLHAHGRTADAAVELGRAYSSRVRAGDHVGAEAIREEVRALDPAAADTLDEHMDALPAFADALEGLPLLGDQDDLGLESAAGAAGLVETAAAPEAAAVPAAVAPPAPPEGFDPTAIGEVAGAPPEDEAQEQEQEQEPEQEEEEEEEEEPAEEPEEELQPLPLLDLEEPEEALQPLPLLDLEEPEEEELQPLPLLGLEEPAGVVGAEAEIDDVPPPLPLIDFTPTAYEPEPVDEEELEPQELLPPLPMLDEESAFAPRPQPQEAEEEESPFGAPLPLLWDVGQDEEEDEQEREQEREALPEPLPFLEEPEPVSVAGPVAPPAPLAPEPWLGGLENDPWAASPEDALAEALALYAQGNRAAGRMEVERLIGSAEAAQDDDRVLRLLDAIAQVEPDDTALLSRRAEVTVRVRGLRGAVDALLALAAAHARVGAAAKASVAYQQILDIDPSNAVAGAALRKEREARPRSVDEGGFIDLGALLMEDDDFAETTRFVVPGEQPTGDEEQDFVVMLEQFKEKVSEQMGEDPEAHYDLGLAYKEMGLVDEAIREFQVALRAGQDRLKVLEELGRCFLLKEQPSVALRLLQQALQVTGRAEMEYMGVYYLLGRCQEQLGNAGAARDAYERVVGLDMQFDDVAERLARL